MGDAVNLSARLMGVATTDADRQEVPVLVDSSTYRQSDAKMLHKDAPMAVEFTALPPVKLKGKAAETPLYRPTKMVYKFKEGQMVQNEGRTQELARLRRMFAMMTTCVAAGK